MPSHHDLANAIRALSMDAVQCANSGHPGMPMGMADIATVLWREHLRHNPKNPQWHNRDRFILSNGHGSMLQYALLHLSGYDLSVDELKRFRQLHSKTPGHPEFRLTPGVETTTGPLGQGLANAVGMALAECHLSSLFNQPGFDIIDHYTYVFLGDGCLMEGISHEAASFAGTLGLGKLIAFWDDNGISIDGEVAPWFSDNTPKRFEAYGWHVIPGIDGHDPIAVNKAIHQAKSMTDKPSLLCCKTTIAFGAPTLAGTAKSHGSPLGESEIAKSREKLGWTHAPFVIPKDIYHAWDAKIPGEKAESEWQALWDRYEKAHPALAVELKRRFKGTLPHTWKKTIEELIQTLQRDTKPVATRKASQHCLNAIGPLLSELLGGSADLTGSNCTDWKGSRAINPRKFAGNYLHYGVREFGMTAIANGLALYGGIIPYTGTFLTFSDYARNAVRLSALMQ
ncbi:MAG: tktA, partial [Gammaproteobacteria bacterium]|nr:tktA [Gammaproteobacteria bacterium]